MTNCGSRQPKLVDLESVRGSIEFRKWEFMRGEMDKN